MSGGRGRGWYYKQKYGRGRAREEGPDMKREEPNFHTSDDDTYSTNQASSHGISGSAGDLLATLSRIDGKGYKAYNDCKGRWALEGGSLVLCVDHVQSDPFAAPSKFRIEIPSAIAQYPPTLHRSKVRKIALCDYVSRSFAKAVSQAGADVRRESGGWGGEKGGEMTVDIGGQHVLERTSVIFSDTGDVEARFTMALPARGRTVLGRWASDILVKNLPRYAKQGLLYQSQDTAALQRHILCVEDTEYLRSSLPNHALVGFIGNGAILPRLSGASDKPLGRNESAAFQSPPSLEVEIELPNQGKVRGMGIGRGVTLIVGGGFHGKSTLLKALEAGISNKIPGDGRELVVVDPSACKIRAEDGRQIAGVNISPFISNLPYGKDTRAFSTPDASGSTSQAANIMEALEIGSTTLLIDEDTTATNFMIRDARMQALIAPDKEPITPLVSKIRALASQGVSCVLVIGGSGDYFGVSDRVVAMDCFQPKDVTHQAHEIAKKYGSQAVQTDAEFGSVTQRIPRSISADSGGYRDLKVKARGVDVIQFGSEEIDIGAVEQILDKSQTRAIGEALLVLKNWIQQPHWRGKPLSTLLAALTREIDQKGLDVLSPHRKSGNLARPREFEIAAALNRLRSFRTEQQ